MKIAIFGDSLVGDPGKAGNLPRALDGVLPEHDYNTQSVGVVGSTVGNWLTTASLASSPGRWSKGAKRALSKGEKKIASLPHLKDENADAYIISLGTNDAAAGVSPGDFAKRAVELASYLPRRAQIVWVEGNRVSKKKLQRRKTVLFDALEKAFKGDRRVLVLRPPAGFYGSGKIHPSVKEHSAFFESQAPLIRRHVSAAGRGKRLFVAGAIAASAVLGYILAG